MRGLIPAYAGSTVKVMARVRAPKAHPRLRGEHVIVVVRGVSRWGSSPLTRGARNRERRGLHVRGLIPAYAGSTLGAITGPVGKAAHPRLRGEHLFTHSPRYASYGSSPLTRGAP